MEIFLRQIKFELKSLRGVCARCCVRFAHPNELHIICLIWIVSAFTDVTVSRRKSYQTCQSKTAAVSEVSRCSIRCHVESTEISDCSVGFLWYLADAVFCVTYGSKIRLRDSFPDFCNFLVRFR